MKPVASLILTIAGMLLTHHAPSEARGRTPYINMEALRKAQAAVPGSPLDTASEWLETLAGRTPRDIPAALLPASGRCLIQAYRLPGGPGAIPTDNVLVEAGKPVPKLMLPKGEYRFAVED